MRHHALVPPRPGQLDRQRAHPRLAIRGVRLLRVVGSVIGYPPRQALPLFEHFGSEGKGVLQRVDAGGDAGAGVFEEGGGDSRHVVGEDNVGEEDLERAGGGGGEGRKVEAGGTGGGAPRSIVAAEDELAVAVFGLGSGAVVEGKGEGGDEVGAEEAVEERGRAAETQSTAVGAVVVGPDFEREAGKVGVGVDERGVVEALDYKSAVGGAGVDGSSGGELKEWGCEEREMRTKLPVASLLRCRRLQMYHRLGYRRRQPVPCRR